MSFLLDTNACIEYLNGRNAILVRRLKTMSSDQVVLCSVVKAELYHGAYKSSHRSENLALLNKIFSQFQSLPFDDRAAEEFGRVRMKLQEQGAPIGPYDLMIAAIALANDATLVTHNAREFSRIAGLKIEDWESSQ